MGLLNFLKDAGEKLFSGTEAKAATAPEDRKQLEQKAADAITSYVAKLGLPTTGLKVAFDGATGTCSVSGTCPDQATKEKVLLAAGNVAGVAAVDDKIDVPSSEPPAQFREVKKGDTLSKISKEFYGDANKYQIIFEANKPMLSHPDKIYPGQMLRIPPLP